MLAVDLCIDNVIALYYVYRNLLHLVCLFMSARPILQSKQSYHL